MSNEHSNYEKIYENDFWKLTVCPECGALLYRYETTEGKTMCVSVLDGMFFHRYGNHNNYVTKHECGYDERQGNHKKCYVSILEVSEEVKEKVKGALQQQAVMKCLTEYSKKGVRSSFKKSMLAQAQKFLNGETDYKNPFSHKQVFCIVSDMISTEPTMIKYTPKKHVEINLKKHVLTFESGNVLSVNDADKTNQIIVVTNNGVRHPFTHREYWKTREDIIEYLYTCEYKITSDETTNNYYINDLVEA